MTAEILVSRYLKKKTDKFIEICFMKWEIQLWRRWRLWSLKLSWGIPDYCERCQRADELERESVSVKLVTGDSSKFYASNWSHFHFDNLGRNFTCICWCAVYLLMSIYFQIDSFDHFKVSPFGKCRVDKRCFSCIWFSTQTWRCNR